MEDFTKEIKEHNLRKALEIEAMGNQENEDFTETIDEVADTLNKSLEDGLIGREEYERDFDNLDQIIQKARPHKYIKREGTTGNYKYYYTLEEYKAAQGGAVDTTEGKEKGTNKLLKLIERIYEEKIDSFKLEGNQLYVQLETGKGYSSDGWSMSGIWDNEKLIIGSHIWTKDSYTNSKSKVTNKRSAYRNKPKEFDLVDALLITKVGPITINIAQELD